MIQFIVNQGSRQLADIKFKNIDFSKMKVDETLKSMRDLVSALYSKSPRPTIFMNSDNSKNE